MILPYEKSFSFNKEKTKFTIYSLSKEIFDKLYSDLSKNRKCEEYNIKIDKSFIYLGEFKDLTNSFCKELIEEKNGKYRSLFPYKPPESKKSIKGNKNNPFYFHSALASINCIKREAELGDYWYIVKS